jgi:hypothetical protein
MITFQSLYEILEYELQQESEAGDPDNATDFKVLRKDIAKQYVNETLDELVDTNPFVFLSIEEHSFNGTTYYWRLPDNYAVLLAYKNSSGIWQRVDDNSKTDAAIRVYDEDTIYNSEGWTRGDKLFVKVAAYRSPVIEDDDPVDIPRKWLRFLRLKIIEKARGNVGKAISEELKRELLTKEQQFLNSGSRIHKRSFIAFKGHGFGNG